MCDPITIGSMALTAISAGTQYYGQKQAAQQQQQNIIANMNANTSALQVQANQVNEQSTQQMSQRAVAAMQERGKFLAFSADSGLGGASQGRVLGDIKFGETQDMATFEANRENTIAQLGRDTTGQQREANQYLSSIHQPSLLGVGLQIAGSGLNAYASQNRPVNKASGPAPLDWYPE